MLTLSAAEYAFWLDYRERYGFELDRLEAVAANGHAYAGATWGGKAAPRDLLFQPRAAHTREQVRAGFDALTPDRFPPRANE